MIMANNLKRQYDLHATEYEEKALEILRSGWYILGNEVKNFENEWAKYIGTEYCVGLASGLDALWMSFKVLGIGEGDEVIVSGNAYIACVMGITINGAKPIFVEPDMYDNIDADKIEEVITPKTKAILAVHLYGTACDMTKIMNIAHKYNLKWRIVRRVMAITGMGKKLEHLVILDVFLFIQVRDVGLLEMLDVSLQMMRNWRINLEYTETMEAGSDIRMRLLVRTADWMSFRPDCLELS